MGYERFGTRAPKLRNPDKQLMYEKLTTKKDVEYVTVRIPLMFCFEVGTDVQQR